MRSIDKGPRPSGQFEEPHLPPVAYRRVPRPGFLNRFLHRVDLVELPQHYPAADRGKNFDFAYLMSIGAIKEDRPPVSSPTGQPETAALITDQAGAIALRKATEESHRTNPQTSPQNLS